MKQTENVIGAIYEMVLSDSGPDLAVHLSTLMDAQGVIVIRLRDDGVDTIAEDGFDPAGIAAYQEYYHSRDIWLSTGIAMPSGRAISLDGRLGEKSFLSSEFYNDFLRHHGDFTHCMGSHFQAGVAHYSMAFQRVSGQREFDKDDEHRFDQIIPHLQRALTARELLAAARERVAVVGSVAETGVERYVVDRALRVVWMDEGSARADRVEGGVLILPDIGADTLRAMVGGATAGTASMPSASVLAHHVVSVDPIPDPPCPSPAALVTVRDRITLARRRSERAASLFGLTSSERVLCESLMSGQSLQEHAEAHGVAISTVRTHVKTVMSKTGASRQAQLVALLSGLDPARG